VPTVSIIMPHISVMSRDLVLNISALLWHDIDDRMALIFHICGIFLFTHAAQFTLHLIFASPATWSSEPIYQASEVEQVHYAE
jgi:hypothetical protein